MLVGNREEVLEVTSVGYADIETKRPMATDSIFWIASETKPITGTALMTLIDEGHVQLEDPVSKYLPELADLWIKASANEDEIVLRRANEPITVRQIMCHISGMPYCSKMEEPLMDGLPLADAVRSYAMTPLESEPGSAFLYSNIGINIGGRIVEVVTGMSFEDFLQERFFGPLGMENTTFFPSSEQLRGLPTVYGANETNDGLVAVSNTMLKLPLDGPGRYAAPAGGLFSTAADLFRYCRMILNGGEWEGKRYLSEAAVRRMTTKQTGDLIPDGFGVGWATDGVRFGHAGAYGTDMTIESGHGLILLWLPQHASYPGDGADAYWTFQKAAKEAYGSKA